MRAHGVGQSFVQNCYPPLSDHPFRAVDAVLRRERLDDASALAGAAGVMVGLVFFNVSNYMGFLAGLKGFTAAVVGGIGSVGGAMLGGLLIGLLESFAAGYLSANFANVISFVALIAVMLIRPRGLLGRAAIVKV